MSRFADIIREHNAPVHEAGARDFILGQPEPKYILVRQAINGNYFYMGAAVKQPGWHDAVEWAVVGRPWTKTRKRATRLTAEQAEALRTGFKTEQQNHQQAMQPGGADIGSWYTYVIEPSVLLRESERDFIANESLLDDFVRLGLKDAPNFQVAQNVPCNDIDGINGPQECLPVAVVSYDTMQKYIVPRADGYLVPVPDGDNWRIFKLSEAQLQQVIAALGAKPDATLADFYAQAAQTGAFWRNYYESLKDDIEAEAAKVEEPVSPEQAEAGNYAKGHIHLHGLSIAIETAKGQTRSGEDKDGKPWSVTMPAHYGYIKGTEGKDKDHLDVYIGEHPGAFIVYVVNQHKLDGPFDEHKLMLGFESKEEALSIYDAAFSGDLGPKLRQEVISMTVPQLKTWLEKGDHKKPCKLEESVGLANRVSYRETDEAELERSDVVTDFGDNAWGDFAEDGDPYLILLDGKPVGWIQLGNDGLNVIEVLPDYQRQGIATEVLRQLYGGEAPPITSPASLAGAALLRRFGVEPEMYEAVDPRDFILGRKPRYYVRSNYAMPEAPKPNWLYANHAKFRRTGRACGVGWSTLADAYSAEQAAAIVAARRAEGDESCEMVPVGTDMEPIARSVPMGEAADPKEFIDQLPDRRYLIQNEYAERGQVITRYYKFHTDEEEGYWTADKARASRLSYEQAAATVKGWNPTAAFDYKVIHEAVNPRDFIADQPAPLYTLVWPVSQGRILYYKGLPPGAENYKLRSHHPLQLVNWSNDDREAGLLTPDEATYALKVIDEYLAKSQANHPLIGTVKMVPHVVKESVDAKDFILDQPEPKFKVSMKHDDPSVGRVYAYWHQYSLAAGGTRDIEWAVTPPEEASTFTAKEAQEICTLYKHFNAEMAPIVESVVLWPVTVAEALPEPKMEAVDPKDFIMDQPDDPLRYRLVYRNGNTIYYRKATNRRENRVEDWTTRPALAQAMPAAAAARALKRLCAEYSVEPGQTLNAQLGYVGMFSLEIIPPDQMPESSPQAQEVAKNLMEVDVKDFILDQPEPIFKDWRAMYANEQGLVVAVQDYPSSNYEDAYVQARAFKHTLPEPTHLEFGLANAFRVPQQMGTEKLADLLEADVRDFILQDDPQPEPGKAYHLVGTTAKGTYYWREPVWYMQVDGKWLKSPENATIYNYDGILAQLEWWKEMDKAGVCAMTHVFARPAETHSEEVQEAVDPKDFILSQPGVRNWRIVSYSIDGQPYSMSDVLVTTKQDILNKVRAVIRARPNFKLSVGWGPAEDFDEMGKRIRHSDTNESIEDHSDEINLGNGFRLSVDMNSMVLRNRVGSACGSLYWQQHSAGGQVIELEHMEVDCPNRGLGEAMLKEFVRIVRQQHPAARYVRGSATSLGIVRLLRKVFGPETQGTDLFKLPERAPDDWIHARNAATVKYRIPDVNESIDPKDFIEGDTMELSLFCNNDWDCEQSGQILFRFEPGSRGGGGVNIYGPDGTIGGSVGWYLLDSLDKALALPGDEMPLFPDSRWLLSREAAQRLADWLRPVVFRPVGEAVDPKDFIEVNEPWVVVYRNEPWLYYYTDAQQHSNTHYTLDPAEATLMSEAEARETAVVLCQRSSCNVFRAEPFRNQKAGWKTESIDPKDFIMSQETTFLLKTDAGRQMTAEYHRSERSDEQDFVRLYDGTNYVAAFYTDAFENWLRNMPGQNMRLRNRDEWALTPADLTKIVAWLERVMPPSVQENEEVDRLLGKPPADDEQELLPLGLYHKQVRMPFHATMPRSFKPDPQATYKPQVSAKDFIMRQTDEMYAVREDEADGTHGWFDGIMFHDDPARAKGYTYEKAERIADNLMASQGSKRVLVVVPLPGAALKEAVERTPRHEYLAQQAKQQVRWEDYKAVFKMSEAWPEVKEAARRKWYLIPDVPLSILGASSLEDYEAGDESEQNVERYHKVGTAIEAEAAWPILVSGGFILDGYHRLAWLADHGHETVDVLWTPAQEAVGEAVDPREFILGGKASSELEQAMTARNWKHIHVSVYSAAKPGTWYISWESPLTAEQTRDDALWTQECKRAHRDAVQAVHAYTGRPVKSEFYVGGNDGDFLFYFDLPSSVHMSEAVDPKDFILRSEPTDFRVAGTDEEGVRRYITTVQRGWTSDVWSATLFTREEADAQVQDLVSKMARVGNWMKDIQAEPVFNTGREGYYRWQPTTEAVDPREFISDQPAPNYIIKVTRPDGKVSYLGMPTGCEPGRRHYYVNVAKERAADHTYDEAVAVVAKLQAADVIGSTYSMEPEILPSHPLRAWEMPFRLSEAVDPREFALEQPEPMYAVSYTNMQGAKSYLRWKASIDAWIGTLNVREADRMTYQKALALIAEIEQRTGGKPAGYVPVPLAESVEPKDFILDQPEQALTVRPFAHPGSNSASVCLYGFCIHGQTLPTHWGPKRIASYARKMEAFMLHRDAVDPIDPKGVAKEMTRMVDKGKRYYAWQRLNKQFTAWWQRQQEHMRARHGLYYNMQESTDAREFILSMSGDEPRERFSQVKPGNGMNAPLRVVLRRGLHPGEWVTRIENMQVGGESGGNYFLEPSDEKKAYARALDNFRERCDRLGVDHQDATLGESVDPKDFILNQPAPRYVIVTDDGAYYYRFGRHVEFHIAYYPAFENVKHAIFDEQQLVNELANARRICPSAKPEVWIEDRGQSFQGPAVPPHEVDEAVDPKDFIMDLPAIKSVAEQYGLKLIENHEHKQGSGGEQGTTEEWMERDHILLYQAFEGAMSYNRPVMRWNSVEDAGLKLRILYWHREENWGRRQHELRIETIAGRSLKMHDDDVIRLAERLDTKLNLLRLTLKGMRSNSVVRLERVLASMGYRSM